MMSLPVTCLPAAHLSRYVPVTLPVALPVTCRPAAHELISCLSCWPHAPSHMVEVLTQSSRWRLPRYCEVDNPYSEPSWSHYVQEASI